MKLDKLTAKLNEALHNAQISAEKSGNPEISEEHILREVLVQTDGLVPLLISKLNLNPKSFLRKNRRCTEAASESRRNF